MSGARNQGSRLFPHGVFFVGFLLTVCIMPGRVPAQDSLLDEDFTETPTETLSAVCITAPAGMVAWWRAESNMVDSVGLNNLFAEDSRFASAFVAGKVGAAFGFPASLPPPIAPTTYLFVPASAELDPGAGDGLSIEGWIRPNSIVGVQPVIEWNDGRGNIGAGLALNGSMIEARLCDTNSTPARRPLLRSPSGKIASLSWQHVALTFDKATGMTTMYVNGTMVGQTNLVLFSPQTKAPVYFAYRASGTNAGAHYSGGIDEMTLYNRGLTAAEIQAIVAADQTGKCPPPPPACLPPPSDFVGWWRGESNALDSVDGNNGFIIGSVGYANGTVGKAFQFGRGYQFGGGYVRIPASSNLNVGAGAGLTIEAWVLPQFSPFLVGGIAPSQEFVGWHSGAATQSVYLSITSGSLRLTPAVWEANLADTTGHAHIFQSPPGFATLYGWQHIALTYDKASGIATLYFNGNPISQTNLGSFTPKTSTDLYLGYDPSPIFPPDPSNTEMDEVGLYGRALTPAEVRAIVLARGTGRCKEPPVIGLQPGSLRVNEGSRATFSVTASGNPILKYQWRRNSISVPGATAASLILTNVQLFQGGTYFVRVTNAFGSVQSSNAVLTVNRPPVADASATPSLVLVPLHCDRTVVLDGSRSHDPDGDSLSFFWYQSESATPLATGRVAIVTLPFGTNLVTLSVDDGLATNTQSFSVAVLSPDQAVEGLEGLVELQVRRAGPLVVSLGEAINSIERDNATAAINQLQAFLNKLSAQVEPDNSALADSLAGAAQTIINILERDCASEKPHGKIQKVTQKENGNHRIQFTAPQEFVYIVEASTNLVDWEKIGVATQSSTGEFEFEDPDLAQTPARFYRVTVP